MDNIVSVSMEIISEQQNDIGETEKNVSEHRGRFSNKGDTYYLIYYDEKIFKDEIVPTILKIKKSSAKLIRKGKLNSVLNFVLNEKVSSSYKANGFEINLDIHTMCVERSLSSAGGNIFLEYDLYIDNIRQSKNRIIINFSII